MTMHVYPTDLVMLINQRWGSPPPGEDGTATAAATALPGKAALERLI